ncbi:MAG: divalent-cation tolerance protein CutA [Candidatus Omnitrophota bacterium]
MEFVAVFITTPTIKEAKKISSALVKQHIVACSNIVKGIDSIFWWQGKIDTAKEVLLIAKTKRPLLKKLIKVTKCNHSYDVPEIIAFPIIGGNKDYLDWIKKEAR